jgi:hypothetical protein
MKIHSIKGGDPEIRLADNSIIVYCNRTETFEFLRTESETKTRYPTNVIAGNMMLGSASHASYWDIQVKLATLSTVPVDIPRTRTRGSYQVLITGDTDDTPAACFFVSKATSTSPHFSAFRVTSSPSSYGENIGLTWPPGELLQVYHTHVRTLGDLVGDNVYNIKLVSNK